MSYTSYDSVTWLNSSDQVGSWLLSHDESLLHIKSYQSLAAQVVHKIFAYQIFG